MADRNAEMRRGMAAIWEKSLPHVRAQLAALISAGEALEREQLGAAQRREAEREAHRLAGSLGTFGFDDGTSAARSLELLLAGERPLDAAQVSALIAALRKSVEKDL